MTVISIKRRGLAPGRGGIPLNSEDDEEEEGDYVHFPGSREPHFRSSGTTESRK